MCCTTVQFIIISVRFFTTQLNSVLMSSQVNWKSSLSAVVMHCGDSVNMSWDLVCVCAVAVVSAQLSHELCVVCSDRRSDTSAASKLSVIEQIFYSTAILHLRREGDQAVNIVRLIYICHVICQLYGWRQCLSVDSLKYSELDLTLVELCEPGCLENHQSERQKLYMEVCEHCFWFIFVCQIRLCSHCYLLTFNIQI